MAILRNVILTLIGILLLTCCNNKKNTPPQTDIKSDLKPEPIFVSTLSYSKSLYGEWAYSFPFYSSELFINKDGTFKFHAQGCTGHNYSEGTWKSNGISNILLTSFEKYSMSNYPKIIEKESEAKSSALPKHRAKNKNEYILDTSFFNKRTTFNFSPSDTSNVYFDNVPVRLEGGTLYRLDKNGLRTDTKFILIKDSR